MICVSIGIARTLSRKDFRRRRPVAGLRNISLSRAILRRAQPSLELRHHRSPPAGRPGCAERRIFSSVILAALSGLLVPVVVIVAALVLLAILLRSA
jgi:hypothetical protein